jgi:hypothetical protein
LVLLGEVVADGLLEKHGDGDRVDGRGALAGNFPERSQLKSVESIRCSSFVRVVGRFPHARTPSFLFGHIARMRSGSSSEYSFELSRGYVNSRSGKAAFVRISAGLRTLRQATAGPDGILPGVRLLYRAADRGDGGDAKDHGRGDFDEKRNLSFFVKTRRIGRDDQLGRRNLGEWQRAAIAERLRERLSDLEKKLRAQKGRERGGKAKPEQKTSRDETKTSRAKMAKQAKVSERKMRVVKGLKDQLGPEVVNRIVAGEVTPPLDRREIRRAHGGGSPGEPGGRKVLHMKSLLAGQYAENEFRKQFSPSERVAIGKAIEAELGDRRGGDRSKPAIAGNALKGETVDLAARRAGFKSAETFERSSGGR